MLEQQIDQDLKTALIGKDQVAVRTLRSIKSAFLYAKVAAKKRETGLNQAEEVEILRKEAKKRQESADLFIQGGSTDRADAELAEKAVIEKYLPAQMSLEKLQSIIEQTIKELSAAGLSDMGKVIGSVKAKTNGAADGAQIASLVKEALK